jgi:hypothetical protein
VYALTGGGSVDMLGTNLAGQISITNDDGHGEAGDVQATASVDTSFDNIISFNGSASFGTDGTVCGLQGSATVYGFTGTASFCGGADPGITLTFSYDGYTLSGQATSSDWSLSTQVAPASFSIGGGLAGFSASVSANWAFDFDVSSSSGLSFNVDGSASVTGSTPIWGPDSASASLSGDPSQVCATGTVSDKVLGQPVSATFQACANSSGISITEPNPPF